MSDLEKTIEIVICICDMIWARCRKFLVAQWFYYHGAFSFSSMRYIPQDQLWLHNSIQGQTPWKHWKWLLRYLSLFLASETVCGKIKNYNVRLYVSRWQFVGWDIIANAGAQLTLNTSDCVRTGSFVNKATVYKLAVVVCDSHEVQMRSFSVVVF